MTITAAADGSSLGNPGPAGWAWYVDDDCWAAGGWESSTNNRGELTAVLELLRATEAADSRARGAATAYQQGRPAPSGPGWTGGGLRQERTSEAAPSSAPAAAPQTDALF